MKRIFDIDSPLMNGLMKIGDCICLSALWLLFSLPVVTIGASSTAHGILVNSDIVTRRARATRHSIISHDLKPLFNNFLDARLNLTITLYHTHERSYKNLYFSLFSICFYIKKVMLNF